MENDVKNQFALYRQEVESALSLDGIFHDDGIIPYTMITKVGVHKRIDDSDKFEAGTPVRFMEDGREVSGEVVTRGGKKVVSLYRDDNYSGDGERISEPDWSKVKTFYGS